MHRSGIVAATAAALAIGAGAWGCDGGTPASVRLQADANRVSAASMQGAALLAFFAGQQALFQQTGGSFDALDPDTICPDADVTSAGDSDNGTVTITFPSGGCTSPFGGVYDGTFTADYELVSGAVVVTVDFDSTSVSALTTNGSNLEVNGSLELSLTVSGTTANGSLSGTVTHVDGAFTRTLVLDLTSVVFDNGQLEVTSSGAIQIDDPALGVWDLALQAIAVDLDPATPCIFDGLLNAERQGFTGVVGLDFTSCNAGTVLLDGTQVSNFAW